MTLTLPAPAPARRRALQLLEPAERLAALRGTTGERTFAIERGGLDKDARTAWFSISSERVYSRWWGEEILDHGKESIRTERLDSGANFLVGHDTSDVVGVVERWEISSAKKLRILVRFGKSARAEEIFQDVSDGIRRNTSVGYIIHDLRIEKSENGIDTFRVTDWEVLEASLVAVPADPSVGHGRQLNPNKGKIMPVDNRDNHDDIDEVPLLTRSQRRRAAGEDQTAHETALQILMAGDQYANLGGPELARELIKDPGASMEQFKARMLDQLGRGSRPTPVDVPENSYGEGARHVTQKSAVFKNPGVAHLAGHWLRGQVFGDEKSQQWLRQSGHEVRSMSSVVNQQGGFLVPDVLASEILDLADRYGSFRQNSMVWPMTSESLTVPRSVADPEATFVSELGAIPEKDASYDAVALHAKKIGLIVRVSSELLESNIINVVDDLIMKIARSFAKKEDECGFIGDGTSTYGGMAGVFWKLVQGTNAGAVDAAATHDTLAEIDAVDLANLVAALPEFALENAKWYCSGRAYGLVFMRLMMAAGGNAASDLSGQMPRSYAGYPVVTSPVLPISTGSLNNLCMIAFGDLAKASKFGLKRQINIQTLLEKYADSDEVGIKATERFDIVVHDAGSATVAGPIVGLIGNT